MRFIQWNPQSKYQGLCGETEPRQALCLVLLTRPLPLAEKGSDLDTLKSGVGAPVPRASLIASGGGGGLLL